MSEAARRLDISEDLLKRLLKDVALQVAFPGQERPISLADMRLYRKVLHTQRKLALDELARLSQEMGLYDLGAPESEDS